MPELMNLTSLSPGPRIVVSVSRIVSSREFSGGPVGEEMCWVNSGGSRLILEDLFKVGVLYDVAVQSDSLRNFVKLEQIMDSRGMIISGHCFHESWVSRLGVSLLSHLPKFHPNVFSCVCLCGVFRNQNKILQNAQRLLINHSQTCGILRGGETNTKEASGYPSCKEYISSYRKSPQKWPT